MQLAAKYEEEDGGEGPPLLLLLLLFAVMVGWLLDIIESQTSNILFAPGLASILRVLLQFALDGVIVARGFDVAGVKARVAGARRRYYEEDCCQIWEGGSRLFNGILDFSYGGAGGDFLRIFCGESDA